MCVCVCVCVSACLRVCVRECMSMDATSVHKNVLVWGGKILTSTWIHYKGCGVCLCVCVSDDVCQCLCACVQNGYVMLL